VAPSFKRFLIEFVECRLKRRAMPTNSRNGTNRIAFSVSQRRAFDEANQLAALP